MKFRHNLAREDRDKKSLPIGGRKRNQATSKKPAFVYGDEIKSVAYGNLVGLLIEAIKEQQIQINDLKDMIINNKESI